MKQLPSFEQRVLNLCYFQGLETATVAKRLKVSGIAVKRVLRAAVQQLRARFPSALPPNAPLPRRGRDNSRHWRYR